MTVCRETYVYTTPDVVEYIYQHIRGNCGNILPDCQLQLFDGMRVVFVDLAFGSTPEEEVRRQ